MVSLYVFIFIVGICVGSFLNVLVFRLDRKSGIWTGRSECPHCSKKISPLDLIPVLSYLILAGRCRNCHSKISPIYPIVEILTGLVFLTFSFQGNFIFDWNYFYYLALLSSLVSLVFFDYLYLILPDKVIFPFIGLAIIRNILLAKNSPENWIMSGLLLGAIFAIIHFASRGRGMGFGDVKLALLIGLVLGYPLGVFVIILSIWIAALWGVLLITVNKAGLKTALPFGSFMASVAILTVLFQNEIQKIISKFF